MVMAHANKNTMRRPMSNADSTIADLSSRQLYVRLAQSTAVWLGMTCKAAERKSGS